MDFITTGFQQKKQNHKTKGQRKKYSFEKQVQLRREEPGSEKQKREFVSKEVQDKWKIEGRCMKCRRRNHQAWDYKAASRVKTTPFFTNANQKPVRKEEEVR